VADAAELGEGFFVRIGEFAFGDGGCFVAAQPGGSLDLSVGLGES
jgi:hypothetical protein